MIELNMTKASPSHIPALSRSRTVIACSMVLHSLTPKTSRIGAIDEEARLGAAGDEEQKPSDRSNRGEDERRVDDALEDQSHWRCGWWCMTHSKAGSRIAKSAMITVKPKANTKAPATA